MNARSKVLLGLTAASGLALVILLYRSDWNETPDDRNPHTLPKATPKQPVEAQPGSLSKPGKAAGSERKPMDLASVPISVRPLLDRTGTSFGDRMKCVEALGPALNSGEVTALYAFLTRPEEGRDDRVRGGEHVLKNDVLNLLRAQEPPLPGLARLLIQIIPDPGQDAVMRDYAVQHLVSWYEQLARLGRLGPASPQDAGAEEMRSAVWDALAETGESIAGTALLGLHNLSAFRAGFAAEEVDGAAVRMVQAPGTGELSRLTALQVCAERGLKQVLPDARRLAETSENIPLRISALAALGALGGPEELTLLGSVATEGDPRLRPAAMTARAKIQGRPGGGK